MQLIITIRFYSQTQIHIMLLKYVANSFVIISWKKPAENQAKGTTIKE